MNDFNMMKPDLDLIYHGSWLEPIVPSSWERLPFEKFESEFNNIVNHYELEGKELERMIFKVENTCKRLLMAWYGGNQAIEEEKESISTQSRCGAVLMGDCEIKVLYYLEATVLLGRSALDLVAYIFSTLILNFRTDSFNELRKKIIETSNPLSDPLKIILSPEEEINWVDLVSGTRGRSLRDKIAHQTVINLEYWEKRPNADLEYCHVIIGENKILLEDFIKEILEGITNFCLLVEDIILNNCN